MQADMILEIELKLLHLDLQAIRSSLVHWEVSWTYMRSKRLPPQWQKSFNKSTTTLIKTYFLIGSLPLGTILFQTITPTHLNVYFSTLLSISLFISWYWKYTLHQSKAHSKKVPTIMVDPFSGCSGWIKVIQKIEHFSFFNQLYKIADFKSVLKHS